jgi:hypothetical protein
MQLFNDYKEKRGYCKLKEEALDRTPWRTASGRGYGPIIRQATELINECLMRLSAANCHRRRENTRIPTGTIKICEPRRSVPFEVTCKKF